jgi:hypothetical protein
MRHDNDDEPLTFIHIAALTANVTRYLGLNEKENEGSKGEPNPSDTDNKRADDQRRYVEQRLREIAAWEAKFMRKRI